MRVGTLQQCYSPSYKLVLARYNSAAHPDFSHVFLTIGVVQNVGNVEPFGARMRNRVSRPFSGVLGYDVYPLKKKYYCSQRLFYIIWLSRICALNVHDEGFERI